MHDAGTVASAGWHSLSCLARILDANSTARVYFRASGGLARLAEATVASADRRKDLDAASPARNGGITSATTCPAARSGPSMSSKLSVSSDGGDMRHGDSQQQGIGVVDMEDRRRFELMLEAVAAALKGGERVAQQDVLKAGLLDGPCARVLRDVLEGNYHNSAAAGGGAAGGKAVGAAGTAALILRRVVDDVDVCAQVAK